jgi:Protein kinase domain
MGSNIELPAFRLPDGVLHKRMPTFLITPNTVNSQTLQQWETPELPVIEAVDKEETDSISRVVENRLLDHEVQHLDSENSFWPPKLFNHLFDRHTVLQIVEELVEDGKLPVAERASPGHTSTEETKKYWTDTICGSGNRPEFRRVLAILILMGKEGHIETFINKNLTDGSLPLAMTTLRAFSFPGWERRDSGYFDGHQRKFKVAFLQAPKPGAVHHYELSEKDIKPWARTSEKRQTSSPLQDPKFVQSISSSVSRAKWEELAGGYGVVDQIIIHPWQHEFQEILQSVRPICSYRHFFPEDAEVRYL